MVRMDSKGEEKNYVLTMASYACNLPTDGEHKQPDQIKKLNKWAKDQIDQNIKWVNGQYKCLDQNAKYRI